MSFHFVALSIFSSHVRFYVVALATLPISQRGDVFSLQSASERKIDRQRYMYILLTTTLCESNHFYMLLETNGMEVP